MVPARFAKPPRLFSLVLASMILAGTQAWSAPRFHPHRHLPRGLFLLLPPETIHQNEYFPGSLGPPELTPPTIPSPGPSAPSLPPTLPEGMAITVNKTLSAKQETENQPTRDRPSAPTISRPKQAAEQLATCWRPPLPERGDTVEATLRFGFDKKGDVLWPPHVTYVKAAQGTSAQDVRASILAAFKACTPLKFTDSMAASMPGYPLAVRFIGRREDEQRESP